MANKPTPQTSSAPTPSGKPDRTFEYILIWVLVILIVAGIWCLLGPAALNVIFTIGAGF
jgi:hypothetical protein